MNNRWRQKKRNNRKLFYRGACRLWPELAGIGTIPKEVHVSGKASAGEYEKYFGRAGVEIVYNKKKKIVTIKGNE